MCTYILYIYNDRRACNQRQSESAVPNNHSNTCKSRYIERAHHFARVPLNTRMDAFNGIKINFRLKNRDFWANKNKKFIPER